MNQTGHTGLIIGSALLALGGMACEGRGHDRVPASSEPGTETTSFEQGTATSSLVDGLIVTNVRDGDGIVVASAEWQVEAREGRIETGQESMVSTLAPGPALTMGLANLTTYNAWADQSPESADEVAYDGDWECSACTGGPSQCCSCEGGSYCCITQICQKNGFEFIEFRYDCSPSGSCSGGGGGGGGCSEGCGGCGCCDNNCCI